LRTSKQASKQVSCAAKQLAHTQKILGSNHEANEPEVFIFFISLHNFSLQPAHSPLKPFYHQSFDVTFA